MELAKLLQSVKNNLLLLLLLGVVTAAIAGGIANSIKPTYTAGLTVYVQKPVENPSSGEYTYDGYYAQQAAEAYTDTVVGLLESQSIISKAAERLNRTSAKDLEAYTRAVTVEKSAPLLISLKATTESADEASTLVKEVFIAAKGQIDQQTSNGKYVVALVDEVPLVQQNRLPVALVALVGAMLGMTLGIAGLFLKEYLKEHA